MSTIPAVLIVFVYILRRNVLTVFYQNQVVKSFTFKYQRDSVLMKHLKCLQKFLSRNAISNCPNKGKQKIRAK